MASKNAGDARNRSKKADDIRIQNMNAAKGLADVLRTSLGPRGMDKMIQNSKGEVLITNDGATILKNLSVLHPIAKILVETSMAQDIEAGDGTTSVVVIAGALLNCCTELMDRGIHPTAISKGFGIALTKSLEILNSIATPIDLSNKGYLIECVKTALSSKVVSSNSNELAPIAVDAVLKICNPETDHNVDLNDIKIVKKLGGTIEEVELVEGIVFGHAKASSSAGGPSRIEKPKIALVQFCLSAPKTDLDSNIVIGDYSKIDKVLKQEKTYIIELVKKIVKSGANVLLIQKSVLREAVSDLALHFLAKKNIMVVKNIERNDVEFICKTIGCIPVAHIDQLDATKLGTADLIAEEGLSDGGKILKVTGVNKDAKTLSLFIRGSNQLVLDEADRSIHDALCVVRSLIKNRSIIPGGGAPEIEIAQKLDAYAATIHGVDSIVISSFAQSLEVIPSTLAENCGLNPILTVTELRALHKQGVLRAALDAKNGRIINDAIEAQIMQPTLVTESALTLATEVVRMILKIDDLVLTR